MNIVVKEKFTDFKGIEHQFVIAAIKDDPYADVYEDPGCVTMLHACIRIGVAICNPIDTFDEEIGEIKALGRAQKADPCLYTLYSGQITEELMQVYVNQEIAYIKKHPEKYISGYKEAEKKYFEKQEMANIESSFTDLERNVVDNLKKDSTFLDKVKKYINYWNKCKK